MTDLHSSTGRPEVQPAAPSGPWSTRDKLDIRIASVASSNQAIAIADGKAVAVLLITGALLAVFLAEAGPQSKHLLVGSPGEGLRSAASWIRLVALFGIGVAVVASVVCLFPRLSSRGDRSQPLFFGNMRSQSVSEFRRSFVEMEARGLLEALDAEIHRLADIQWRKYRALQVSFIALAVGIAGVVLTVLTVESGQREQMNSVGLIQCRGGQHVMQSQELSVGHSA